MSVTNDLVTDQRVHRSATVLQEAGYDVTLVGRLLPESAPLHREYKTVRMRLLFRGKVFFYAEYNFRLFLKLLFSKADIFYANDTDTLLATFLAAKIRRKSFFFDAHEMFPEVPELVGRPRVKRVWQTIENWILPKIRDSKRAAAVTVCQSFADIYHSRYGIEMGVVRNVPISFPHDGNADEILSSLPNDKHILLYQGAVNIGRGVEWVVDAMQYLPDCHYVIAGVGDVYDELRQRALMSPAKGRITFLGRVEPSVLHSLTSHACLGLALLENRGMNYYYTLPNRIADFVQGHVPILGTDFPEVRRVVEEYGIGTLLEPQPFDTVALKSTPPDSKWLADKISETISYWEQVPTEERNRRFEEAAADLSFSNDKMILLHHIGTII